ncbi:MAG: hypothetical protein CYG59_11115 [Chloroflexi bacterium]|nr:MAG: hypothetical protein CYG59_11115 [Chloroflexota bacterium]
MIARRRKPVEAPPELPTVSEASDVQRALRLGWTVAETFGRLRVYQPEFANKRNDPNELPRFSYSNSDLSSAQQLEVSYRRLVELAAALDVQPPAEPDVAAILDGGAPASGDAETRKRIHGVLEAWSRATWIQLNVRSAALGRAMTYGGSLADTYWYMALPGSPAFLSGRQSIEALLRPQRLKRMQERMSALGESFPGELCDAIGHSLGMWMFDEAKERWAAASDWQTLGIPVEGVPTRTPPQQLHFNLFRQVRTWRDLLFESRQPLDYVSPGFRRRANLLAGTVTIVMVLLVAVIVGALVFGAFNLALNVANRFNVFSQIGGELIEAISVLVTVTSTIAVLGAGLLARARRAVEQFDAWLESMIIRRAIRRQTTIAWNDLPRRPAD